MTVTIIIGVPMSAMTATPSTALPMGMVVMVVAEEEEKAWTGEGDEARCGENREAAESWKFVLVVALFPPLLRTSPYILFHKTPY